MASNRRRPIGTWRYYIYGCVLGGMLVYDYKEKTNEGFTGNQVVNIITLGSAVAALLVTAWITIPPFDKNISAGKKLGGDMLPNGSTLYGDLLYFASGLAFVVSWAPAPWRQWGIEPTLGHLALGAFSVNAVVVNYALYCWRWYPGLRRDIAKLVFRTPAFLVLIIIAVVAQTDNIVSSAFLSISVLILPLDLEILMLLRKTPRDGSASVRGKRKHIPI